MDRVIWRCLILSRINHSASLPYPAIYDTRTKLNRWYSSEDGKNGKSAADRLNDLLQSIVKESKDRKEGGEAAPKKIDFKLAVRGKQELKKVKDKIQPPPSPTDAESPDAPVESKLSPELVSAVKSVAVNLGGDPQATESELVQKLKTQQTEKINLRELFHGMKIDRTKQPTTDWKPEETDVSRAHRVRRILNEDSHHQPISKQFQWHGRPERRVHAGKFSYVPIDLFGAKPLGIFPTKTTPSSSETPFLSTWDRIHEKELKLAAMHPPANGFEEMILWTEQGKLWHFPIDNEQAIGEEEKYDFTDHVFLEPVIESWCPKKGPIRRFMELVTVALSKNPYLSVPEKHEYLNWYHNYFKEKADIIKEVGAGEIR